MKCLSCDAVMNDKEANRKYLNHEEIKNPEEKYIGLCDRCLSDSDLVYYKEDADTIEIETEVVDLTGDCV